MKFRFQNIRNIFQNQRLKAAFTAVKTDIDILDDNHNNLKLSVNDWVIFLDKENRDLKLRIKALESQLNSIENKLDRKEFAELTVLRSI